METEEWKTRIKRWQDGIDVKTAPKEDLNDYVNTKIQWYALHKQSDGNLWELFQEDFITFDITVWNKADRTIVYALRAFLRCGGVYVKHNGKQLTIAQSLVNVIREETQSEWEIADITEKGGIQTDLMQGPITSAYITLKGLKNTPLTNQSNQYTPLLTPSPSGTPIPPPPPPPPQLPSEPFILAPEPLQIAPPPASRAKLIGEIARIYTDEQKWDGGNGSFDQKLTIFYDICERVELPKEAIMKAFPTMLKGLALDYFYNNNMSKESFNYVSTHLRGFFEGPGYQRRNLDRWNAITWSSISEKHTGKSTFEVVQLMINELRQLQYGLTPALRTTEFLHNKIITTCQDSEACKYAVSDPPMALGELLHKLQSSITAFEKLNPNNADTFFTDRRYRSNNHSDSRQFGNRRYHSDHTNPYKPRDRDNDYMDPSKSCFICGKSDCRSWKHTDRERREEKTRFRTRNLHRFRAPDSPGFKRKFTRAYLSHIASIESERGDERDDGSGEDELSTAFDALLVDMEDPEEQDSYFTSVETLFTTPDLQPPELLNTASDLVNNLMNRSCTHLLTGENHTTESGKPPIV
jgi:hypothetical protein